METIQTSILIPVYNEEKAISHVLCKICEVIDDTYEIIVINDGSNDNTAALASTYPCRIVRHEKNRGKGAAMQTGILHARGERIIFIDGDGTYPPQAIPQIAAQLENYDLVRCIRSEGRDNIPLINRTGNLIFDWILKTLHNIDGTDLLSGLYGVKKSCLIAMHLESIGFDIESEIACKAKIMDLKELSIPVQYQQRQGEKKLRPFRDGLKILSRILLLVVFHNPTTVYLIPGVIFGILAIIGLVALSLGPVKTPFAGFSVNTFIVSVMTFLVGFQLIVFGSAATLYTAEIQSNISNSRIIRIFEGFPRSVGVLISLVLILIGIVWTLILAIKWVASSFGPFEQTQSLVIAMSLIVWGVQIASTLLFLSLFNSLAKRAGLNQ